MDEHYTEASVLVRRNQRLKLIKIVKRSLIPVFVVSLLVACLIPTQKEAVFIIAGGKTIDWAMADTSLNKIPSQTTAIISRFLEYQEKEISEIEVK